MSEAADTDLKRVALQHLESLQRAGVTHLPKAVIAEPLEVESLAEAAVRPEEIQPEKDRPVTKPTRSAQSLEERVAQLEVLNETVRGCVRCGELAAERTQTVFGVGNPEAKIMFIGEAPGADEDKQGEPFVGRAGKLMNKIIEACNIKREEIYIANILKCRPPSNRNPSPEEAGNCREYLLGQIETVDPDYIVCWGTIAAQNLLNSTITIGKLRHEFHTFGRAKVLCTYHPSYLLRNPSAKKDVWEDMQLLFKDMGIELTA